MTESQQNPTALMRQGDDEAKAGRLDVAADLYLAAGAMDPEDSDFQLTVCKALETVGRLGKAQGVYVRALKINPDNFLLQAGLGEVYFAIGRTRQAITHLELARALNPENPGVLNNLGLVYRAAGRIEDAIESLQQALANGGPADLVIGTMMGILEGTNRLGELKAPLADALKKYPKDVYLNYIAAKVDRRNKNPGAALARLTRVAGEPATNEVMILYNFELARVYDRLGVEARAMDYFEAGNGLMRLEPGFSKFDPKDALRRAAAMKNLNLSGWQKTTAHPPPGAGDTPTFLIGFPRSGTTLLHQILDGHPEIEVIEERPFISFLRRKIRETLGAYPECLAGLSVSQLDSLRDDFIKQSTGFRTRPGAGMMIDKLPLNIVDVPLIVKLFPGAKFILALRHPCDVVLSCFMQNFSPNNSMIQFLTLKDSFAFYTRVMDLWLYYQKALEIDCHIVKYENVITGLEAEARGMIGFLGLPWRDEVLNYRAQAKAKEHINTPSYHQVVEPIYQDADGRWRRYREYLKPYFGEVEPFIKAFGYKL